MELFLENDPVSINEKLVSKGLVKRPAEEEEVQGDQETDDEPGW